jgi:hypothetical protein
MISTRRIVAAVGLAVGVTGLAAPMATAAGSEAHDAGKTNSVSTLDSLALSDIPAENQAELMRPSAQLGGLNRLNDLSRLHQVTDLGTPATGLAGGIES